MSVERSLRRRAARIARRPFIVVAVLVVGGAATATLVRSQQAVAAPAYSTVRVSRGDIALSVSATGPVVAPTSLPLSFKSSGRISAIPVEPGQSVHAGDVLARLDDTDLRQQFEQAQAALAQQQAALRKLRAGAPPDQRAVAQAQLDAAKLAASDTEA